MSGAGVVRALCDACQGTGAEPGTYVRLRDGECDYDTCARCQGEGDEPCGTCGQPSTYLSSLGHCEGCALDDELLLGEVFDAPAITSMRPPPPAEAVELVVRLRWLLASRAEWQAYRAEKTTKELLARGAPESGMPT